MLQFLNTILDRWCNNIKESNRVIEQKWREKNLIIALIGIQVDGNK